MAINVANNQSLTAITALPAAVSGGAMTLLETQTASSSATLSFTSNIDSTYKEIEDQELFLTHGRKRTALEVLAGLKEFIDYRGSMNIIEKLAELDDEESGE